MEEYQFLIGFIIVAMVFIGYVVQLYRGAETTCDMVENLVEWFMTTSMNSKKKEVKELVEELVEENYGKTWHWVQITKQIPTSHSSTSLKSLQKYPTQILLKERSLMKK